MFVFCPFFLAQDKSPPVESTNAGFFTASIVIIGLIAVCFVTLVGFGLWYYWWNREKKSMIALSLLHMHSVHKGLCI